MKYVINENEKKEIIEFCNLTIPTVFKMDKTALILFLEEIDFSICKMLLNGETITKEIFYNFTSNYDFELCPCYNEFLSITNNEKIYENEKAYCDKVAKIMEIFEKYYCLNNK